MRKVTELEAMTISKEHRLAVQNSKWSGFPEWIGKATGIERTLQMLGIRFKIEADVSLSFKDVER